MSGIFISFEGPDGAGKTTALEKLLPLLKERTDKEVVLSREPGGSIIAEKIRKIILDIHDEEMDPRTEALLYAAARRQHLVDAVLPALDEGKVMLSDRFVDSSIAYQGGGRQIGTKEVTEINDFAIDGHLPDLTIYFDVTPDVGLSRIRKDHEGAMDRLEKEALSFHQRVYDSYMEIVKNNPDRIKTIDAAQPVEKVVADALDVIIKRFPDVFNGGK
ncbi:dTMP kinase [Companilactobacillus pabuli]|jgi:dTMP kinase|uniref:Thymidylate kinase n=1 Tax=Companilactobacillus pabuli TaxID=2714036 RepID=A0A7L7L0B6_9LACO|nr:dTMP kinase [Companilactobacillus pabuli]AKP02355.1 thymidylate kinase [Companilactobacillus farciminis]AKS50652.1 thymidylate kinase [Companilactobacillus farciminis]MDG5113763.1 dTMP kinase [Companilactobacillus pabuli]QMT84528.1 dTMP kinase [Companilactobacillus pabuli]GAQ02544.1 thymidylate kinase [Companilactobacillus farciminis]